MTILYSVTKVGDEKRSLYEGGDIFEALRVAEKMVYGIEDVVVNIVVVAPGKAYIIQTAAVGSLPQTALEGGE